METELLEGTGESGDSKIVTGWGVGRESQECGGSSGVRLQVTVIHPFVQ